MKTIIGACILSGIILTGACNTVKKTENAVSVSPSAPANNYVILPSAEEIVVPGGAELNAIRARYNEMTLEKLKEGYTMYSGYTCTQCHEAKNISRFDESRWKNILDDMAVRAGINDPQKDAIFKYVLSVKAAKK